MYIYLFKHLYSCLQPGSNTSRLHIVADKLWVHIRANKLWGHMGGLNMSACKFWLHFSAHTCCLHLSASTRECNQVRITREGTQASITHECTQDLLTHSCKQVLITRSCNNFEVAKFPARWMPSHPSSICLFYMLFVYYENSNNTRFPFPNGFLNFPGSFWTNIYTYIYIYILLQTLLHWQLFENAYSSPWSCLWSLGYTNPIQPCPRQASSPFLWRPLCRLLNELVCRCWGSTIQRTLQTWTRLGCLEFVLKQKVRPDYTKRSGPLGLLLI